MQQTASMRNMDGAELKRMEAIAETSVNDGFPSISTHGETVAEMAHDARNMVAALGLYCDLLEEPGVLANKYSHYGSELRLVASASLRLVERLAAIDGGVHTPHDHCTQLQTGCEGEIGRSSAIPQPWLTESNSRPGLPIGNLAVELFANHHLLLVLAGSSITVTIGVDRGARPVRLTSEDLTRVLVNLVKNAAEAMPSGGRIQIELRELAAGGGAVDALTLTVEDNGPGIPEQALQTIFESGYTTHGQDAAATGCTATPHRGLGLFITRSIVEAAGGRIRALNRPQGGARFEIELPARKLHG